MPSRKLRQRIQDILEMSLEIEDFTKSMTFIDFQNDRRTIKAVLYNLAIIGEAAGSLLPEIEILYPEIPWIDIRGIRNIVVHEYFRVNLEIIWKTIQTDLPPLVKQLREVMEQISNS